jgi:hypothetical protein
VFIDNRAAIRAARRISASLGTCNVADLRGFLGSLAAARVLLQCAHGSPGDDWTPGAPVGKSSS